jgi:DNA-binding NarL/FixJ family response regulator
MRDRPIRILIADDHPVFRFGLRALLESQPDMVVLAEVDNGEAAVQVAQSLQPDLVLMDVGMLGLNGIEATRIITATTPDTAILMITMFDDETVFSAMQAGARGYLLKGAQGEETLRAIRAVANGELIFSSGVAKQMMAYFARGMKPAADAPFPDLTPREGEILELLAQGLTNAAIAEKLALSPKTIRNQVSNIFSKLQVATRTEAIIEARQAGLGHQEA